MSEPKKIKVTFAPGCLDSFDGTQEELDAILEEITRLAETGQLEEMARPVDLDDEEDLELISKVLSDEFEYAKKKLQ